MFYIFFFISKTIYTFATYTNTNDRLRMNAEYYISPSAVSVTPNAHDENPDYIGISVVGGSAIRVKNIIHGFNSSSTNVGYDTDLSYKTWKFIGANIYAPADHDNNLYIYIRLDKYDTSNGIVMVSSVQHSVEETATLESGAQAEYYYLCIGELSAPSVSNNNKRELLSFDTGELDTNQGNNNEKNGDFEKAFELDTAKITPKLPFFGLKLFANSGITFLTNSFFKFGENGTAVNELITTVSETAADFSNWAKANAIATTQSIVSYCRSFFIRKDADDVTNYKLTVNSLACSGNNMSAGSFAADITGDAKVTGETQMHGGFVAGDQTSQTQNYVENVRGSKLYWNGSGWQFDCDYLQVNKKAFFKEVEIEKASHIGGQQILTACGCKLEHVFYYDNKWFVFFPKEDADGNAISNDWKVGDLAYCQSFNVGAGVTENAGNRYYWVRVTDVEPSAYGPYMSQGVSLPDMSERTTGSWDSSDLFNSGNYHCIAWQCIGGSNSDSPSINSSTPCAINNKLDSDTPKAGDNIVLLGHVKQPNETEADAAARQGATLLAGAGTWGQALVMWRGIGADASNPFVMPEPQVVISPQRVKVLADEIALSSSGKLLLSSDQLTCTNTDGAKTMWLDALGNVNIAGILNKMQIDVEGEKFGYYFNTLNDEVVPTYPDQQNAPDTLLFSDDDGAVMLTHLQEQDSNNIYDPSQWNNGILRVPDMLRMDGIVRLGYETSSDNNGVYDRGEQYQIVFPFIFPYEREMQLDGINYNVRYETCRTATSANGTRHLMTWNELNSIVGRKITFESNGPRVLIVYPSFTKEGLVTQENGELVTRTVYTFNGYNLTYASRLGFTIEYVSGIVKHSINGNDYELDRGIFPFLTDITQAQYPTAEDWGEVI